MSWKVLLVEPSENFGTVFRMSNFGLDFLALFGSKYELFWAVAARGRTVLLLLDQKAQISPLGGAFVPFRCPNSKSSIAVPL